MRLFLPFGAILAGGTKDQRDRYLPGLASGELRAAFSTTEPQSGSDVQGIKTKGTPVAGGYRLDGAKIWCTNSHVADFILVAAKTADPSGKSEISLFVVEKGAPGFPLARLQRRRSMTHVLPQLLRWCDFLELTKTHQFLMACFK